MLPRISDLDAPVQQALVQTSDEAFNPLTLRLAAGLALGSHFWRRRLPAVTKYWTVPVPVTTPKTKFRRHNVLSLSRPRAFTCRPN